MTYGIIGLGTMGAALARALLTVPEAKVIATTRSSATAQAARQRLSIDVTTDNVALAAASDVVVLCVKPDQARDVVEAIAHQLDGKTVITICAAVTTADIENWSEHRAAIIRAMPNTPCLVGAGMTVIAAGAATEAHHLDAAVALFSALGRTAVLDEGLMDAAAGLSGCGPAYVFLIIESLAEAGVKLGIDRATSTLMAAQTLYGAAQLALESGKHPAALKDEVTTPAGCTIDGLMALEDGRLRSTLIGGVIAAAERSRALRTDTRVP
jgi:pyrroline-5-carboxylate reductase